MYFIIQKVVIPQNITIKHIEKVNMIINLDEN